MAEALSSKPNAMSTLKLNRITKIYPHSSDYKKAKKKGQEKKTNLQVTDQGVVVQSYALYPHLTVYENMAVPLTLRKVPKDEIDKRVKEAAEILDITQYLDRKPKALSGCCFHCVLSGKILRYFKTKNLRLPLKDCSKQK